MKVPLATTVHNEMKARIERSTQPGIEIGPTIDFGSTIDSVGHPIYRASLCYAIVAHECLRYTRTLAFSERAQLISRYRVQHGSVLATGIFSLLGRYYI